ncbi:MAG: glutamate-5-semialdehyde dehydrogenase [Ignavibacteriales bacterium]|nr:glutamate-5-semialdehyde dehydrogenase [Ignavibacteriales bacterium]
MDLIELAKKSRSASNQLARLSTKTKNEILSAMAESLRSEEENILQANAVDIQSANEKGLSSAMIDRLLLTKERINSMAEALEEIVLLADPVGLMSDFKVRPNGLQVAKMSIPLGVIAIIYEARPNVTSDAAGLCLKSGNAVILRGGSEAFNSNVAVVNALHKGLEKFGVDTAVITFVPTTDREAMLELLKLDDYIDLVIPRGGEGLIRFVAENSRVPVIKHYKGVCHLYVDKDADIDTALRLLIDGKTSRPGVCNALETMIVHKEIAEKFLPLAEIEMKKRGVEIRGCEKTKSILPEVVAANDEDFGTEFLSLIIASRVVENYDEAVSHIEKFGSNHTDVIVTNNLRTSQRFIRDVNSSSVMVNASSRFADGGEMGLGAEIGISTTKLHAYGPMGLDALTTKKFVVIGEGQTRHKIQ